MVRYFVQYCKLHLFTGLDLKGLYNDTVPTDVADVYNGSLPNAVVRRIHQRTVPYTAQTTDK